MTTMTTHTFDVARLRTLTTGILHSNIRHVYEDLETLLSVKGIMTHEIPNYMNAVKPWLQLQGLDESFWDSSFDPDAVGTVTLTLPSFADRQDMMQLYASMPDPLFRRH